MRFKAQICMCLYQVLQWPSSEPQHPLLRQSFPWAWWFLSLQPEENSDIQPSVCFFPLSFLLYPTRNVTVKAWHQCKVGPTFNEKDDGEFTRLSRSSCRRFLSHLQNTWGVKPNYNKHLTKLTHKDTMLMMGSS